MKIGVLGGTFDPMHNAHLVIAEEVQRRFSLREVIFVPAGQPWLKTNHPITPAEHRLAMLRLALAGKPRFTISKTELKRDGPSYSVDTMAELRGKFGDKTELYFILGWDSLNQLPRWHEPERLASLCTLVAVHRPGVPRPDLKALDKEIPGISGKVIILDSPSEDISATDIRERVKKGLPVHHLVPMSVAEYIKKHKLYLSP